MTAKVNLWHPHKHTQTCILLHTCTPTHTHTKYPCSVPTACLWPSYFLSSFSALSCSVLPGIVLYPFSLGSKLRLCKPKPTPEAQVCQPEPTASPAPLLPPCLFHINFYCMCFGHSSPHLFLFRSQKIPEKDDTHRATGHHLSEAE